MPSPYQQQTNQPDPTPDNTNGTPNGTYQGIQTNFLLYACVPESLKLYDSKIGDFTMPELDFGAYVNAAGNLGIVSVPVTS